MTEPSEAVREVLAATDLNALGYWCQSCREVGMLHCAEVESCSGMKQLPYKERAKRYAALRTNGSNPNAE